MNIAIIGAGNWGTALAKHLAAKADHVVLWAHEKEVAEGINKRHRNPYFLPKFRLPEYLTAEHDLKKALHAADVVVSVVPSQALRSVWKKAARFLKKESLLVSCTKGIEPKSLKLMSQVLDDCLPTHPKRQRMVLSGPSFAEEVAKGLPTSVVIAGSDDEHVQTIQNLFRTPTFLPFRSQDVIGVQVGGAIKNIIAIAAGCAAGLRLGHNTRAAIITRGVYEMIKIGMVLGAKPLTFAGLSGLGDLVLTCTGELSRNYRVGKAIGSGKRVDLVLGGHMIAEGMETSKAVAKLSRKHRLHLPICDAVHRILHGKLHPQNAVKELTALPLAEEMSLFQ
ncbi:MAG: NAD(P)-dependent glycerol-3-phosphate dehydrogenase [Deltaproteobacteria bacterium]|nr:NAD(P)-dependent glycerol-3-phosphate dehydrogenase [Deltaproteobacteria bacterium]